MVALPYANHRCIWLKKHIGVLGGQRGNTGRWVSPYGQYRHKARATPPFPAPNICPGSRPARPQWLGALSVKLFLSPAKGSAQCQHNKRQRNKKQKFLHRKRNLHTNKITVEKKTSCLHYSIEYKRGGIKKKSVLIRSDLTKKRSKFGSRLVDVGRWKQHKGWRIGKNNNSKLFRSILYITLYDEVGSADSILFALRGEVWPTFPLIFLHCYFCPFPFYYYNDEGVIGRELFSSFFFNRYCDCLRIGMIDGVCWNMALEINENIFIRKYL